MGAIEARGLTRYYGELLAVDHIDLSLEEGELFGLLGPNGAGKTTTIRMLIGLLRPSEGQAWVNGYDVIAEPLKVKASVGVVPETSNLYDELSLYDNLVFMAQLHGVPRRQWRERAEELLHIFELYDRRNSLFQVLSKGLKRRLTIAAALMHRPSILFLDEPTVGLDVVSARTLRGLIASLNEQGVTVFLTSHYLAEAEQLCDRVAILVEGQIKTIDTPTALRERAKEVEILEVSLSRIDKEVREALEALPGVAGVSISDAAVRLYISSVEETLPRLTTLAMDSGLTIRAINTVTPTLEDAFVKLTGLDAEIMKVSKGEQR